MPPINVVFSLMADVAFILVALGFWPLLRAKFSDFAFHMMRGVFVFSVALLARSTYWDVVQFVSGAHWQTLRTALGGQAFSTVFILPLFFCAYDFLKARWLLIPEEERNGWTWWNAWRHPNRVNLPMWRDRK